MGCYTNYTPDHEALFSFLASLPADKYTQHAWRTVTELADSLGWTYDRARVVVRDLEESGWLLYSLVGHDYRAVGV